MKYNELKRLLRKHGCYPMNDEESGHPVWFSPITGQTFATSHHGSKEIATGTLKDIKKKAGIK